MQVSRRFPTEHQPPWACHHFIIVIVAIIFVIAIIVMIAIFVCIVLIKVLFEAFHQGIWQSLGMQIPRGLSAEHRSRWPRLRLQPCLYHLLHC